MERLCRQCSGSTKLWDSLGRIEGIWAVFYTGMVTVDNDRLYWKKCAGHMGIWRERSSLEKLNGRTGLIRRRPNSGGDERRIFAEYLCDGTCKVAKNEYCTIRAGFRALKSASQR